MWTKICGIRDLDTALAVVDAGADAIGLNFFARSPRSVAPADAAAIVRALPEAVESVGLFVNHSVSDVQQTVECCKLTMVQIHGDEPPEFLAELQSRLPDLRLLRAFRIGADGCSPVADYLAECRRLKVSLAGCLADARVTGSFGGTGHTLPWDLLVEQYDSAGWPRLVLAGGLTPENVARAIEVAAPWGVDTASGVESVPGVKDLDRVRRFIASAKERA